MTQKRDNSRYKKAYASLAAWRHGRPGRKLRLIVVAGEHGKTTTARFIREILIDAGKKVAEMTASESDLADFQRDVAVLQKNLASAHKQSVDFVIIEANQAFLDSLADKTIEIDTLVITSDSPVAQQLLKDSYRRAVIPFGFETVGVQAHNTMTFGFQPTADMSIHDVKLYRKGTEIKIVMDQHDEVEIASFLIGRANAENIAAALAAAYVLGVKTTHFSEGVAKLEAVPGNFEYVEPKNTANIEYSVAVEIGKTPDSIAKAIAAAHDITKRRLLIALAKPCTSDEIRDYKHHADRLIYVGDTDAKGVTIAADPEEAAIIALRAAHKGDLVLLIGEKFLETANGEDVSLAQSVTEKMAA